MFISYSFALIIHTLLSVCTFYKVMKAILTILYSKSLLSKKYMRNYKELKFNCPFLRMENVTSTAWHSVPITLIDHFETLDYSKLFI